MGYAQTCSLHLCTQSTTHWYAKQDDYYYLLLTILLLYVLRVLAKIKQFTVYGSKRDGETPQIISSRTIEKSHLLDVMFETNPMDRACDQRLRMVALPLQIVYDARTLERMVDMFRVPKPNVLSQ